MGPTAKLASPRLSYIPDLELDAIAEFIRVKAPGVEILTLSGTSPDLGYGQRAPISGATGDSNARRVSPRQASVALHAQIIRPLCTSSFSISNESAMPPPTNLRLIELATSMLAGLGVGAGSWRIIRSKGGRGSNL